MAELAVHALINGASALGSSAIQANAQKQAAKQLQDMAPPTLTYDEALKQSQDVLNPLYDEQLEKNLQAVDRSNIARGFYGQMPGDAFKRSTAGEIESARAGQIASLAQQMQGQSQQQALQQQQLAAQYALSKGQMAHNSIGMGMDFLINTANLLNQFEFDAPNWLKGLSGSTGNVKSSDVKSASTQLLNAPSIDLPGTPMFGISQLEGLSSRTTGLPSSVHGYLKTQGPGWTIFY